MNHAIAVKAVITNESKEILVMKRSGISGHAAEEWDIPGGRIDPGEDPFTALKRECMEEVGMEVEIGKPLGVNYFTRDDGQIIVMIIFSCTVENTTVVLSEEHSEYDWANKGEVTKVLHSELAQHI